MAAIAAAPAASCCSMRAIVSYHAPTKALPNFGFAASVAVFTTMRSMISPGIFEESNTSCASGADNTALNCGFQVTTAVLAGVAKAPTISASEVFTIFTSRSRKPTLEGRASEDSERPIAPRG